jgi:hypothetical protein
MNCKATSNATGSARRYGTACLRAVAGSLATARTVVNKTRSRLGLHVQRVRRHRNSRRTLTRAGPATSEPHLNSSIPRLVQNAPTCVLGFFAFGSS